MVNYKEILRLASGRYQSAADCRQRRTFAGYRERISGCGESAEPHLAFG